MVGGPVGPTWQWRPRRRPSWATCCGLRLEPDDDGEDESHGCPPDGCPPLAAPLPLGSIGQVPLADPLVASHLRLLAKESRKRKLQLARRPPASLIMAIEFQKIKNRPPALRAFTSPPPPHLGRTRRPDGRLIDGRPGKRANSWRRRRRRRK